MGRKARYRTRTEKTAVSSDEAKKIASIRRNLRHNSHGELSIDNTILELRQAIKLANRIGNERKFKHDSRFFSDPLAICARLARYSQTDKETLLAAVLYPVLRPLDGAVTPAADYQAEVHAYFAEISNKFGEAVTRLTRDALRMRSVNLLAKVSAFQSVMPLKKRKPQSEQERLQKFHHMIGQITDDPRVVLIRGAQRVEQMNNLPAMTREQSAEYQYLSENVYVPVLIHHNLKQLASDFQDQCLRVFDPNAYENVMERIREAEEVVLIAMGQSTPDNDKGREVKTLNIVKKKIESLIPADIQPIPEALLKGNWERQLDHLPLGYILQYRVKKAHSAHGKLQRKGYLNDVVGFRLIVIDPNERKRAAELYKAFKRNLETVPGAADDYMHNIKKNRYQAIHDEFFIPDNWIDSGKSSARVSKKRVHEKAAFEIQITGGNMHMFNEFGEASHDLYKGFVLAGQETTQKQVSVYTLGNEIHTLPYGATTTDLAAYLHTEIAFSFEEVKIDRVDLFADPNKLKGDPMKIRLLPGDHVEFIRNPALIYDSERRQKVIELCTVAPLRRELRRRSKQLEASMAA